MRAALLMHGKEADPVFCYANHTAHVGPDVGRIHPHLPSPLSAERLSRLSKSGCCRAGVAPGGRNLHDACRSTIAPFDYWVPTFKKEECNEFDNG